MAAGDITNEGTNPPQVLDYQTATAAAITKGQVVYWSSGNVATATASTDGPYGVCLNTVAASATDVRVLVKGVVYLTASGAITKGQYVSAAASGKVAAYSKETITTTPTQADVQNVQNKFLRLVGVALDTAADAGTLRVKLGGFTA